MMNSAVLAARNERSNAWSLLGDARVDRAIGVVASVPFAYMIYYRLAVQGADLPRVAMAINFALLIVTMAARRPPVRVTTKPLYWATAFLATYWGFMTLGLMDRGAPIAPTALTHFLAVASLAIALCARLSLGRNIGFVPAQRQLVTCAAYAWVRHPIYSGVFVSMMGVLLRSYSSRNLLIIVIGAGLFVIKSFMEEDFLKEDLAYARYIKRVRSRWIPFVA
jgi:protein-S-isoprenylcysteine O-methyltransferase Ste14